MTHPLDVIPLTPRETDAAIAFAAPFRLAFDALMALPLTDARVWAEGSFRASYLLAMRAFCEGVEKQRT